MHAHDTQWITVRHNGSTELINIERLLDAAERFSGQSAADELIQAEAEVIA